MPSTIFPAWPEYLVTCGVLVIAQTIYVLFGFGSGLIAVGCLALLFPEIKDVVVLLLLVSTPAEIFVVLTCRRNIVWRGVLKIFAGILVGIPLGAYFLRSGDPTVILLVLGGFLVLAGVSFLAIPRRRAVSWPWWTAPPTGLISGLLTGLFGTGGPPVILFYQLGGAAKTVFRGNLMAIFFLMTFVRLPSYAAAGLLTTPRLWSGLAVLPAILVGVWLGQRIHIRLAEATFRRLVCVMLVVLGVLILLGGCSGPPDGGELFTPVKVPDFPAGGKTYGGTLLHIDDDGRLDLLLSVHGNRAETFLNRGGLRFARRPGGQGIPPAQPDHHGSAACDFDHDGDWDVYVTVGAEHGLQFSFNQLWRQESPGRFTAAAASDQVLQDPMGRGRGALWADFDGVGAPELLLLNYASQARLLAFAGGRWHDTTWRLPPPAPVTLWSTGRPPPTAKERARSTWVHTAVTADLDGDGRVDLLSMGRAGGWSGLWLNSGTGQFYDGTCRAGLKQAFFPHVPSHAAAGDVDQDGDLDLVLLYRPDPVVKPLRGPLELWRNDSQPDQPRFTFVPAGTGLTGALDPGSALLADLDCDGFLDLYVVQHPAAGTGSANLLFQGDGQGNFQERSAVWGGTGPGTGHTESAWAADLDGDGDLDLLTFNGGGETDDQQGGVVLYENTPAEFRGITVELAGGGPPHGLGARLELQLGERVLVREIASLANPLNSTVLPAHFGLGSWSGPLVLKIRWPDGQSQQVSLPPGGSAYAVTPERGAIILSSPRRGR